MVLSLVLHFKRGGSVVHIMSKAFKSVVVRKGARISKWKDSIRSDSEASSSLSTYHTSPISSGPSGSKTLCGQTVAPWHWAWGVKPIHGSPRVTVSHRQLSSWEFQGHSIPWIAQFLGAPGTQCPIGSSVPGSPRGTVSHRELFKAPGCLFHLSFLFFFFFEYSHSSCLGDPGQRRGLL